MLDPLSEVDREISTLEGNTKPRNTGDSRRGGTGRGVSRGYGVCLRLGSWGNWRGWVGRARAWGTLAFVRVEEVHSANTETSNQAKRSFSCLRELLTRVVLTEVGGHCRAGAGKVKKVAEALFALAVTSGEGTVDGDGSSRVCSLLIRWRRRCGLLGGRW